MFDWINSLAVQVDSTFKLVVFAIAGIVAFFLCKAANWSVAGCLISIVLVAFLAVAVTNMDIFARRIETDVKNGNPPVVQVVVPDRPA